MSGDRPSAVVCGAGVFGASVADRLARSGWDVTLVEPFTPGHVRAGSGGESRLIRCAHGEDPWHARLAARAAVLWDELDDTIRVPAGVAWFAQREDGWEAASERTLRAEGIAVERLDLQQAASLFPSLRCDDLAFVLWEPGAGILRARDGVRALVQRALDHGARLVHARARPDGRAVLLDDGAQRLEADVVVWACGAWLPGLYPELLGDLRITQQDVFFFGADAAWTTPGVPGWVDYDAAAYGLGDLDGRGVKVSPDVEGPPIDAEHGRRVPLPANEHAARAYLEHRFPALARAPLVFTRTCHYEITTDTRFILAPHPEHDGHVWLLGGGSGHGFKHGPALAELVEGWIERRQDPDARFALGPREAATALRTAGGAVREG
jgi:glycine/D-amino acid oxidase-like deaminating enzyme